MDSIDTNSTATRERGPAAIASRRGARAERSVLSLTFESFAIRMIVLGVSFVSNAIVARQLGPEGKGILAMVLFWSGLIATLLVFGLDSALIYLLGSSRGRFRRLLRLTTVYALICTALVAAVVQSLALVWESPYTKGDIPWFLIALTGIMVLTILISALFIGVGRISVVNLSNLIGTSFYLLLLIVANVQKQIDAHVILWINLAAQTVPLFVLFWSVRAIPHVEGATIATRATIGYALKAYLGNIAGLLSARANFLMLSFLVSLTDIGIFSIAQMFSDLILILPMTLINVLLPRVTPLAELDVRRHVSQTVRCTFLSSMVGAVGVGGLATILIPLVFGSRFALAVPIVWILVLGSWLGSGGMVLSIYFNSQGHPEVPSSAAWIGFFVVSLLTLGLTPKYAGYGAASALSLSRLITTLYMLVRYLINSRERVSHVLLFQPEDWSRSIQKVQNLYESKCHSK